VDPFNRLNVRPNFRRENLPCDGKVGDLVVLSPLAEGEYDGSASGLASVWICVKGSMTSEGEQKALWARVQFDGVGECEFPIPKPPQDLPPLTRG